MDVLSARAAKCCEHKAPLDSEQTTPVVNVFIVLELVEAIAGWLVKDKPALNSLSLTSTLCCVAARPVLFSTVSIDSWDLMQDSPDAIEFFDLHAALSDFVRCVKIMPSRSDDHSFFCSCGVLSRITQLFSHLQDLEIVNASWEHTPVALQDRHPRFHLRRLSLTDVYDSPWVKVSPFNIFSIIGSCDTLEIRDSFLSGLCTHTPRSLASILVRNFVFDNTQSCMQYDTSESVAQRFPPIVGVERMTIGRITPDCAQVLINAMDTTSFADNLTVLSLVYPWFKTCLDVDMSRGVLPLLGHCPQLVDIIVSIASDTRRTYWLHESGYTCLASQFLLDFVRVVPSTIRTITLSLRTRYPRMPPIRQRAVDNIDWASIVTSLSLRCVGWETFSVIITDPEQPTHPERSWRETDCSRIHDAFEDVATLVVVHGKSDLVQLTDQIYSKLLRR